MFAHQGSVLWWPEFRWEIDIAVDLLSSSATPPRYLHVGIVNIDDNGGGGVVHADFTVGVGWRELADKGLTHAETRDGDKCVVLDLLTKDLSLKEPCPEASAICKRRLGELRERW